MGSVAIDQSGLALGVAVTDTQAAIAADRSLYCGGVSLIKLARYKVIMVSQILKDTVRPP